MEAGFAGFGLDGEFMDVSRNPSLMPLDFTAFSEELPVQDDSDLLPVSNVDSSWCNSSLDTTAVDKPASTVESYIA